MGGLLETRRSETKSRFEQLQRELSRAAEIAADRACVYATGSFARGEATKYSDLDLFIVGLGDKARPELSYLDETCLKANLIEATRSLGIPDFSGDGEYLIHYTDQELVETLGKPHDDASNTFTARLLLLLESKPVIGDAVYEKTVSNVVAAYWRDYEDHKGDFLPAFLTNDILRLWRTFCVNYEARTATEPEEKKAKRKLKNYKLKHSRLLTCYSAILHLLTIFKMHGTVHRGDALEMTRLTPTARLEWLLGQEAAAPAHETVKGLLEHYEGFLTATDAPEEDLLRRFLDREESVRRFESANKFGDLMFETIELLGQKSRLHRVLVV